MVGVVPSLLSLFHIGVFMRRRFYLASVLVFPCQFGRVHCCPFIFPVKSRTLPVPHLSHIGNFYNAKRYFRKKAKALAWAAYVVNTHTAGSLAHPLITGGQLSLF
jgi:hypothetical protein